MGKMLKKKPKPKKQEAPEAPEMPAMPELPKPLMTNPNASDPATLAARGLASQRTARRKGRRATIMSDIGSSGQTLGR